MSVGPGHFAVLSALVLGLGVYGVLTRRGAAGMLPAVALLLLAPAIAAVGFAHLGKGGSAPPVGDALALFALSALTATSLLGAGLALLAWRRLRSAAVDDLLDAEP